MPDLSVNLTHHGQARGELYVYAATTNQWTTNRAFPGDKICYPIGLSIQDKMYVGLGGVFANNTCTLSFSSALWEYAP
jgi:hypothetical protein